MPRTSARIKNKASQAQLALEAYGYGEKMGTATEEYSEEPSEECDTWSEPPVSVAKEEIPEVIETIDNTTWGCIEVDDFVRKRIISFDTIER